MYELIRHDVKVSQATWRVCGWENEMEALKEIYNSKKSAYWERVKNRVILNGVFGK